MANSSRFGFLAKFSHGKAGISIKEAGELVELFYLQLTILAILLTVGAFWLTALAFLLTIGAFLLTVEKCV